MKKNKVIIIGSGPAGYSAAIYTVRANYSPLLFLGSEPGGQLMTTTDVENWPGGGEGLTGPELMESMNEHAKRSGVSILPEQVDEVDLSKAPYKVISASQEYLTDTIIIATGAKAKYLGIESEKRLIGSGVSACATCDGFFYRNQEVAVIGGGNTALEEALYLTKIAKKVYLIHRREQFRAEAILQDRLNAEVEKGSIELVLNYTVEEVLGSDQVKGIALKSTVGGDNKQLDINGMFVAIGHSPNTSLFNSSLEMKNGYLITNFDGYFTQTSKSGIFAAGDVADPLYRQAITSAGSGCMAALDAVRFLGS